MVIGHCYLMVKVGHQKPMIVVGGRGWADQWFGHGNRSLIDDEGGVLSADDSG